MSLTLRASGKYLHSAGNVDEHAVFKLQTEASRWIWMEYVTD